jgi:hypothetical protein
VLDTCLGAGVPVAGYVGGGYDDDLEVSACVCVSVYVYVCVHVYFESIGLAGFSFIRAFVCT